MNRLEQIQYLIGVLLKEMPVYQTQAKDFPRDEQSQRRLLRSLMNVRPPLPLDVEFLAVQDELLLAEQGGKRRGRCRRSSGFCLRFPPDSMAGGYYPAERGRHRECRQFRPAGVFRPLSRLHRQRHPFGGGASAPGRVQPGSWSSKDIRNPPDRPN